MFTYVYTSGYCCVGYKSVYREYMEALWVLNK